MSAIAFHTPQPAVSNPGNVLRDLATTDSGNGPATLIVDEFGVIRGCNRTGEAAFGYRSGEIISQHVSMLLPQLQNLELMQDGRPNSRLRFLCRTGHQFRALTSIGGHFSCKLFFNLLDNTNSTRISLIVRPIEKAAIGHKSETLNG